MMIKSVIIRLIYVFLIVLIFSDATPAQNLMPRQDLWAPNGRINAIIRTPDTIYFGGDFTQVGPYTGSAAAVDTQSGYPYTPYPQVSGVIKVIVPDLYGGWYMGGLFSSVGGIVRNNIAHILSDGTLDL